MPHFRFQRPSTDRLVLLISSFKFRLQRHKKKGGPFVIVKNLAEGEGEKEKIGKIF